MEEIYDYCQESGKRCVLICQHTSCTQAGSQEVLAAFEREAVPDDVEIIATGCQGQCSVAATVRVIPEETWYYRVKPEDVPEIVAQHLQGGKPVAHKLNPRIHRRFG